MAAESYGFTNETLNFARLVTVAAKCIPNLFREVLTNRLPPEGLSSILNTQKAVIIHKLTRYQRNLLFQSNLAVLDVSTLYMLLRNLVNIQPHTKGWGRTPDTTDRSLSANLDRLRIQRNKIAHAQTTSISDTEFYARWSLIRKSVDEVEKSELRTGKYTEEMDKILTMTMSSDSHEIQNFLFWIRHDGTDFVTKEYEYKQSMRKTIQTQTIKLTFIGHARAGKSCLMKQLLRKQIKPDGPNPTNLAELLLKRLRYKLGKSAKEREKIEKGKEAELCRLRLRRLRKRKAEQVPSHDDSNESTGGPTNFQEENRTVPEGVTEEAHTLIYSRTSPDTTEDQGKAITEDQRKAIEDINKENDSMDDSSVAYVTLFDFGGDKVFRNYHHCILSSNSINLLVFDASMFENPEQQVHILDEIEYWLNSVVTYGTDARDDRDGVPPIILIGSHMDKVTMDEADICENVYAKLKERPGMEYIFEFHVQEIFCIADMNKSDKNEEKYLDIWCEIENCVDRQSCWHEIITGSWLALEEKITLEKEKRIKFLNIQQILDINSQLLIPVEEGDLVPFLRYMHNAGNILCFDIIVKTDSNALSEHEKEQIKVILDINWVIKAFGAIITDDHFVNLTGNIQRLAWKKYKSTAMLTEKILEFQWKSLADEDRNVLISEMEKLGFITEAVAVPYKGSLKKACQRYVVPCLLSEGEPDSIRQILSNESLHLTKSLCLVFDHRFVPQAIWDKTVALCLQRFGECTYMHQKLCPRRGFLCRSTDDIWNFVLHSKGAMLKMTMFNHHDHPVTCGVGKNLKLEIEDIIKTVLSIANQGHLSFSYYLHCDFWVQKGESHLGKPKISTLLECSKYRVDDVKGNSCFLTQDDCLAWFGDDKKVPETPKFTDMTKVKRIHAKMVRLLSKWICPGLKERWATFLSELGVYLGDDDRYGVPDNDMYKICDRLMGEKWIEYGEYTILRDIVKEIHTEAAEVIDDTMVELSALRLHLR